MTGTVVDFDSRLILPGVVVQVIARGLLFETEVISVSDTTDSLGRFTFSELVPGRYDIFGLREERPVGLYQIVIFDTDREIRLPLPKPIDALRVVDLSKMNPPEFQGFCWKYSGTFAAIGFWDAGKYSENRVFEGNFNSGFQVLGQKRITPINPEFYGLTYLERYWMCDSTNLLNINATTGKFDSAIPVPFKLLDLTNDGKNIWGAMEGNRLLKFDQFSIEIFNLPLAGLEGIAWDGQQIWVGDSQLGLIFKLDENLNPVKTFRPFYVDEFFRPVPIETCRYLAFDPAGHLWVGDGSELFEIEIDPDSFTN